VKKNLNNLFINLILLILINLISTLLYFRIDLTEDKKYSISSTSKNIINEIDDVMYIKDLILSFREDNNSSLSSKNELIPRSFTLHQNYPNPFNPLTTIDYTLNERSRVYVAIYDISGRLVKTLLNGPQSAGNKSLVWNSTNNKNEPLPGGLYIYSVSTENSIHRKKMMLLK